LKQERKLFVCSQKSFVEATEKRKTAPDRVIFKFFFLFVNMKILKRIFSTPLDGRLSRDREFSLVFATFSAEFSVEKHAKSTARLVV
jgi:hypothetical protein